MKKYTLSQLGIVFILLFALSCKKYDPKVVAVISTGNVNGIYATQAQAIGKISGIGDLEIIQHGHCWSSANDVPDFRINQGKSLIGAKKNDGSFTSNLSNLYPNTTFYVRSFYITPKDTIYGNDIQVFKTKDTTAPLPPNVATGVDSAVFAFNFYIKGSILNIGSSNVSSYGHCYSSSNANPTILDSKTTLGNTTLPVNFTSNITGLSEQTKYYVRAYATNATGTAYGTVVEVTTKANKSLASVYTSEIFDYDSVGHIILFGTILNTGNDLISQHGHVYNEDGDNNPTLNDFFKSNGSINSNLSFRTYLNRVPKPITTYNIKAFATNSSGTVYGDIYSYTTGFKGNYNSRTIDINKFIGGVSTTFKDEIYFGLGQNPNDINATTGTWTKYNPATDDYTELADCPYAVAFGNSFLYNDKIYVISGTINNNSGNGSALFSYDPSSNQWAVEQVYSSLKLIAAAGFLIDNKYYLSCGQSEIVGATVVRYFTKKTYVIDLTNFTMSTVADLPSDVRGFSSGFAIDGKGYIVGGFKNYSSRVATDECWEYNPKLNTWTSKSKVPTSSGLSGVALGCADVYGNFGYYFLGTDENDKLQGLINRYNPKTDDWEKINTLKYESEGYANVASFVGKKMVFGFGIQRHDGGYSQQLDVLE